QMFEEASSLTSLNLSNWNTSNVIRMNDMFKNTSSLTSLDLSSWDTSNVIDMSSMFYGASNLASLNLSGWVIHDSPALNYIFHGATSLTNITYSKKMTSMEYGKFLSFLSDSWAILKDNGTLHIGSNTCSDATCSSAKATLEDKGWVFSSN
ncbi:MAG: BspA family leucine-rich repeat surface protein, partial [Alphaproteobacteria bacterium]|nr:BspA family leucine-rich repeat surface protein [Alphaproteobacteria bacterium]